MSNSIFLGSGGFTNNGVTINPSLPMGFPAGSVSAPSITNAAATQSGLYFSSVSSGSLYLTNNDGANAIVGLIPNAGIAMLASRSLSWTSATSGIDLQTGIDTQLTRQSSGVVNVTTGYAAGGTAGVATFGPSAVASITVKGGIVTAVS